MNNKFVYVLGLIDVRENVRLERVKVIINLDVDEEFVEFYKSICEKIGKIININNFIYILSGEGILGFEVVCVLIIEFGDRVFVIDNGIYGRGFKDFVEMYGGEVIYFFGNYNNEINVDELSRFLVKDYNFKYVIIVYCDILIGVLNDLFKICVLLNIYGILIVVDLVFVMGGEEIRVDDWKIDIVLGGF